MFPSNQSDSEVLTRLLDRHHGSVPNILTSIAEVLVQNSSFFDADDGGWQEVLVNIFRDQVSRDKERKADDENRRRIVKKRFEIIMLQNDLQKHYSELNCLLNPSSDNIESNITDTCTESAASFNDPCYNEPSYQVLPEQVPSDHKDHLISNAEKMYLEPSLDLEPADVKMTCTEMKSTDTSTDTESNKRKSSQRHQIEIGSKYNVERRPVVKYLYKMKRPRNAYIIWMSEHYKRIQMENPHMRHTEVSKLCGTTWDALEDKSEWYAKYAEEMRKYKMQLEKFNRDSTGGSSLL